MNSNSEELLLLPDTPKPVVERVPVNTCVFCQKNEALTFTENRKNKLIEAAIMIICYLYLKVENLCTMLSRAIRHISSEEKEHH